MLPGNAHKDSRMCCSKCQAGMQGYSNTRSELGGNISKKSWSNRSSQHPAACSIQVHVYCLALHS
jgi:hypothetical protein